MNISGQQLIKSLYVGFCAIGLFWVAASATQYWFYGTRAPVIWKRVPVQMTTLRAEHGSCWVVEYGKNMRGSGQYPLYAELYENGTCLGPGNALHDDIRSIGRGRYSFWKGTLYFSTSDNSSPLENGRRYEMYLPAGERLVLYKITAGWFLLALALTLWKFRKFVKSLPVERHVLPFLFVLALVAWAIPRLPLMVHYPVPIIQYDSPGYITPVRQIYMNMWPNFEMRSPGYPLFLMATSLFSREFITVMWVQCLLSLISVWFFLWSVWKTFPTLTVLVALVMVIHLSLPLLAGHDFVLLSESLFTSCLLVTLGLLLLTIKFRSSRLGLCCSLAIGYLIWIRPGGVFILPAILLIAVGMVLNRYPRKARLSFLIPAPVMLAALMLYNYLTLGFFGLSSMGNICLYGATAAFWQPANQFPREINEGIVQFRAGIAVADQKLLAESWNAEKLYPILANNASRAIYLFKEMPFEWTRDNKNGETVVNYDACNNVNGLWRHAVRAKPLMFVKWTWCMLCTFLMDPFAWEWQVNVYGDIARTYEQFYKLNLKAYFIPWNDLRFPNKPLLIVQGQGDTAHVVIKPSLLADLHMDCTRMQSAAFGTKWWTYLYLLVFLAGMTIVIRRGFKDVDSVLILAVLSLHLAAGMVSSLTTSTIDRYSSPTKFIVYLSIPFGLLLLKSVCSVNVTKAVVPMPSEVAPSPKADRDERAENAKDGLIKNVVSGRM